MTKSASSCPCRSVIVLASLFPPSRQLLSRKYLVQPGGSLHPVMEQFKVPLFKGGNSNQMIISADMYC